MDKDLEFATDFQSFNPMLDEKWTKIWNLLWVFKVLTQCRTRIGKTFEFTTDFQSLNLMSDENWTKPLNLLWIFKVLTQCRTKLWNLL
jgi:hypothetical protein